MFIAKIFSKWLRNSERRESIAVRPSRTLDLPLAKDAAFDRCKRTVVDFLGAAVREEDRWRGYIESSPGLIFSERICFTLEPLGADVTRVIVESRRIAGSQLPPPSSHLAAVADYLLRS